MARLEHIGIAVEDVDAVLALYEALLDVRPYRRETVAREGVRTHFVAAGPVKLELLEALGPDSPVARSLKKRGEGLHHVAFEVDDVQATFERVRSLGFEPLGDAPHPGADGKVVFFLHPGQTHGVLVEFCQGTGAPLEPVWIDRPAGPLAVYRAGAPENPAVVLVHGRRGSAAEHVAPLLRRLEPTHHVLALDLPGHGRSAGGGGGAPRSFAEDVVAMMDHFDVSTSHLVGLDTGGLVVLELAHGYPDRAARLVVHEVPDPESPSAVPHTVLVSSSDADDSLALAVALRRRLPSASLAVLPGAELPLRDADLDLYARLVTTHFT